MNLLQVAQTGTRVFTPSRQWVKNVVDVVQIAVLADHLEIVEEKLFRFELVRGKKALKIKESRGVHYY
jgi:hypothetical protein